MFLLSILKDGKRETQGKSSGLQNRIQVQGAEVFIVFLAQHIWKKLFELEFVFFYLFNIYIYIYEKVRWGVKLNSFLTNINIHAKSNYQ